MHNITVLRGSSVRQSFILLHYRYSTDFDYICHWKSFYCRRISFHSISVQPLLLNTYKVCSL